MNANVCIGADLRIWLNDRLDSGLGRMRFRSPDNRDRGTAASCGYKLADATQAASGWRRGEWAVGGVQGPRVLLPLVMDKYIHLESGTPSYQAPRESQT